MSELQYVDHNELNRQKAEVIQSKTQEMGEVSHRLSLSALRVLAARYLIKDEQGNIIETPEQMFERIAILITIPDILHDKRVFDIAGGQIKSEDHLLRLNASLSIGEYSLNEYHVDALCRLYSELDSQHRMRVSSNELVDMIDAGDFDDYQWQINKYYELMTSLDFLPNTPTLMNAGAKLGQLSACFVLDMKDDLADIMQTSKDAAMIFKSGGGVGINYSKIRPEGSMVASTQGVASGPLSFMKVIDAVTEVVKQGGKRRGANMAILDWDHPDIHKFINCKRTAGEYENFNISVGTDEKFWTESGGMIDEIAKCAWESAEPGLIFFDTINRFNPLSAKKGEITATNPCFHPDTIIETVKGPMKIKDFASIKEPVRVYTCDTVTGKLTTKLAGMSWITRKNAKTVKITMNNGKELIVTPDHKLLGQDFKWIEAKDLTIGTQLVSLCRARRGTRYSGIKLSSEDNRAYRMEHRFVYEQTTGMTIPKGKDVHHINGDTYDNSMFNLSLIDHNEHSRLSINSRPNNHQVKGELGRFVESGKHGEKTIIEMPESLATSFPRQPTVVKLEEGPITDVYDIAVDLFHNLIANGVVAHNCGEQSLYPYESCNLGSINLANFVIADKKFDWKRFAGVVSQSVQFLDNVIDMNKYPLTEIEEASKASRRIGLGIMGIADCLFQLGIAYNSKEGYEIMAHIASLLNMVSYIKSQGLANERGSYPLAGVTVRNSYRTTIAPTGTLSMIADCTNGVEPVFALAFEKRVTVGSFYYVNKYFEQALKDAGVHSEELVKQVVDNYGSCKGIEEIPEEIRKVFVTAMDIHWQDHVMAQSVWQKYIDNAIAKTINMPNDVSVEDVKQSYIMAHALGCKGVTVYRDGSRHAQVLHIHSETKQKKFQVEPSSYIKHMNLVCPSCGTMLTFTEGCASCRNCGTSMCSSG